MAGGRNCYPHGSENRAAHHPGPVERMVRRET
jgi:hypothetical protein